MKKALMLVLFVAGGLLAAQAQADSTFKSYLGKYSFPDGSVVSQVEVSGDSLAALTMTSEAGSSPLVRLDGDNFNIVNFNGTATFKRAEVTKEVTGVHIEAMGYVLDGEKAKSTGAWTWTITYADRPNTAKTAIRN